MARGESRLCALAYTSGPELAGASGDRPASSPLPGRLLVHSATASPRAAPAVATGRWAVTTPEVGAAVRSGPYGTSPAARTIAHASLASNPTTSGTSVIRGRLRTP